MICFLFNYVCACVIEYGYPRKPNEGYHQIPWSWICSLVSGVQSGSWELNSRPLQEQQDWTRHYFFSPPHCFLLVYFMFCYLFLSVLNIVSLYSQSWHRTKRVTRDTLYSWQSSASASCVKGYRNIALSLERWLTPLARGAWRPELQTPGSIKRLRGYGSLPVIPALGGQGSLE